MKLYIIRHGETDHNVARRIQGPLLDDSLNARGKQQADALEAALREQGVQLDAIYASPLKRAFETAEAVARGTGVRHVERVAALREFSWGIYLGLTESGETLAAMEALHAQWKAGHVELPAPEGESPQAAWLRARDAIFPLLSKHSRGAIALVAHGRINKIMLAALLHGDVARMQEFSQGNTSVTLLEREDGAPPEGPWRLVFVNRKDHLRGDLAELPSGAKPLV